VASNGGYDGPTTPTASAAPTFEVLARVASELSGRKTALVVLDPDEWVAAQVAAGQQEFRVRFLLGKHQAAKQGLVEGVDPLLGVLLGREPRTVRDVLADVAIVNKRTGGGRLTNSSAPGPVATSVGTAGLSVQSARRWPRPRRRQHQDR
jgi:hypothetical protein